MTTCTIPIGARGQYRVKVDAADARFLTQWTWSFSRAVWRYGANVYACRCVRRGGRKVRLYMHTAILEERMGLPRPSAAHQADHLDRNTLDNTRGNLRWVTRSQQNANRGFLTKPQMIAHAVAAAGCARTARRKTTRRRTRTRTHKGR
jgi:hypothetical protein